ncbi:hypothetical protein ANCDUO_09787 [Ancylostoma duodenale]|uniref:Tc1-like transposase DDE domain-containing protein n=1 Tax=Ancylostoma duodenale TaxID=51022 RepID=A0A0C2GFQ6_9BILA|nr:hypothetical protein ANCDUO_09787 [Ancylostoma duodenale]
MLRIWWSVHDFVEGSTVTADVYTDQLRSLKANLENARPQQHEVYLQHDNARLHNARTTKAELMKFGWTILSHPPYSPDLIPAYNPFSHLQGYLEGEDVQTCDDIRSRLDDTEGIMKPSMMLPTLNLHSNSLNPPEVSFWLVELV